MKMKSVFIAILILSLSEVHAQCPASTTPAGTGIISDPYQIASFSNLRWLSETPAVWGAGTYFIQTANINASCTSDPSYNAGAGFSPIGNTTTGFSGNYNGLGFVVSDLFINRNIGYVGLFGYTSGASISGVSITACSISAAYNVGALCGFASNNTTISNCHVSGSVTGAGSAIGGVIGTLLDGVVSGSYAEVAVNQIQTSSWYAAGGLAGRAVSSTISYCYTSGTVIGGNGVGGLAGQLQGTTSLIINCYSESDVTSLDWGSMRVGGFLGRIMSGRVSKSFANGTVTGGISRGGFVGILDDTTCQVDSCYFSGVFQTTVNSKGFAHYNYGTILSCYWDAERSGVSTSAGGTGLNTCQMKTTGTFESNGWRFPAVWTQNATDNNGYPALAWQNFLHTGIDTLEIVSVIQVDVTCFGAADASASISVGGGTPTYTYAWSPSGGTNATASGLTAGAYTCTTTDANGCTLSTTFNITAPSALIAASSASTLLCNGDTSTVTVTASGGISPYLGTGTFNEVAGTYTYIVTDNNGCVDSTTITITEPPAFNPSAIETDLTCFGGSDGAIDITISGATPPYTYDWNNGQFITEDISNLTAGTYVVVVTDLNGCTLTGTLAVVQPAAIADNGIIANASGCTTNDGFIDLTPVGGTGLFTYLWSTNATSEDIYGLDGGVYSVIITDSNNCTATATFIITEPGAPTVTFAAGLDTVCQSTTTPFTLTGASPAGGVFSGTGMINDTVFDPMTANLGFNVITYTYTDSLGCTGSAVDSILVDVCTDLASQVSGLTSQVSIFPNPNNGVFTVITSTFADMMIYDAQGKLVTAQKVQAKVQNQVNIEQAGMYLITFVTADGSRTTQRVVATK